MADIADQLHRVIIGAARGWGQEDDMADLITFGRACATADWLIPAGGARLLVLHALRSGTARAYSTSPAPWTGDAVLDECATIEHGRGPHAADWWDRFAHGAHTEPPTAWRAWLDERVTIEAEPFAAGIDALLTSRAASDDDTAREDWTAPQVLGWIATRDKLLCEALRPDRAARPADAWPAPFRRLLWALARREGTWQALPGEGTGEAKAAFAELRAALRQGKVTAAALIDGRWQRADADLFAGARFNPRAAVLDLATGLDLRFDAEAVRRHWPATAQRRGRPRTIDHEEARKRAKAERASDPTISKSKAASIIANEMNCDPRGMERIIAPLWEDK